MESTIFNPAQQRILQMMSFVKSPEDLKNLEHVLSAYFSKKVDDEMEQLWEEGKITSDTIEQWGKEHMRTY